MSATTQGRDLDTITKPDELLALHDVTEELFDTLRSWFDVPEQVELDIAQVDSAVEELTEPVLVIAMAMRKLQTLHLIATPGVRTSTDVVVAIVQGLNRALLQAPAMRLDHRARATDWDAELRGLLAGDITETVPAPSDDDPETERFRTLHSKLHDALAATVEASDGEIRYLI